MGTPSLRSAVLSTLLEYLLVVTPVAVYVWIVALSTAEGPHAIGRSPEWNIATIFVSFQAVYSILKDMNRAKRVASLPFVGLALLSLVLVTIAAVKNIELSIPTARMNAVMWMWIELIAISLLFLLFVTGSRLNSPSGSDVD